MTTKPLDAHVHKLVIFGRQPGLFEFRNVFYVYFNAGVPWSPSVCTYWYAEMVSNMRECCNPTTEFYQVESYLYGGWEDWQAEFISQLVYNGARAGTPAPPQLAYCAIARIESPRTFSRKWIAGINIEDVPNGYPTNDVLLYVGGFANTWANIIHFGEAEIVQGMVTKAHEFQVFTEGDVSPYCATMRRRRPGYGT